ncbi:hypothetical protein RCL1_007634 [Eukaryota sp. TZLM3-RCL]
MNSNNFSSGVLATTFKSPAKKKICLEDYVDGSPSLLDFSPSVPIENAENAENVEVFDSQADIETEVEGEALAPIEPLVVAAQAKRGAHLKPTKESERATAQRVQNADFPFAFITQGSALDTKSDGKDFKFF